MATPRTETTSCPTCEIGYLHSEAEGRIVTCPTCNGTCRLEAPLCRCGAPSIGVTDYEAPEAICASCVPWPEIMGSWPMEKGGPVPACQTCHGPLYDRDSGINPKEGFEKECEDCHWTALNREFGWMGAVMEASRCGDCGRIPHFDGSHECLNGWMNAAGQQKRVA